MNIVKIIFFILMLTATSFAEKIDVVKHTSPGGLVDRMNEVIAKSLGDNFGQFIQVKNCVQAVKVIEKHKGKVLTAWPTEREAKGNPCNLENKFLLSTFSNSPYHITYLESNSEASDIDFLTNGSEVIVGVWDSNFWAPPQTAFLQSINPNIKVVRYKGKPFRTALASGEIDYKVVSFPGQDPVIAIMDGKHLNTDHKFSNMGYSMMFVGNFDYDIARVYSIVEWQDRTDSTHQPWMPDLSKDEQINRVEDMLSAITEMDN